MMRGYPIERRRRRRVYSSILIGQLLSLLIHVGAIFGVFLIFNKPDFGIQTGVSGVPSRHAELSAEVEIEEAAPAVEKVNAETPEEKKVATPEPDPQPKPSVEDVPDMAEVLQASEEVAAPAPAEPAKVLQAASSVSDAPPSPTPRKANVQGGGGGKKSGDRSGDGGAQVSKRPSYKFNPQPDYPAEARKRRQEGLVRIQVWIDSGGNVTSVSLRQGSGFPRLDEAALSTVRIWKFFPATIGGIGMESFVEVPVRFKLEN